MTVSITTIVTGDKSEWLALWQAYLSFYEVNLDPAVTEHTWARLTDPSSPLNGRLARGEDGRALGFALHHHHVSTWVAGEDCYLEDLFVDAQARGMGVGRALIDDLIALARTHGWNRLYWHTDEGNARARTLYDSYVKSDGHIRYRLTL
ncbi:MAG: GNAT family N-acetyltransferase [Albidovulum sp.]